MDAHLGYENHSDEVNNTGISRNGSFTKKIQTRERERYSEPRDRKSNFEPNIIATHESRGLSIEMLVISLYAKRMSVSDIEDNSETYMRSISRQAPSLLSPIRLHNQPESGRTAL